MGARRRERPGRGQPGLPVPPPELANGCVIENWLTEDELAALRARQPEASWQRTSEPTWQEQAMVVAWRLHRVARDEWLRANGIPRELECQLVPRGRPRWRNTPLG